MTAPLKFLCTAQVVTALRLAGLHGPASVVLARKDLPYGFPRNTREKDGLIYGQFADASTEVMLLTGQCSPDDFRIWRRADVMAWIESKKER